VHKFLLLTPEEVLRATQLHLTHNAYNDMRTEEQVQAVDRRPMTQRIWIPSIGWLQHL
jgi:hypothetical protein